MEDHTLGRLATATLPTAVLSGCGRKTGGGGEPAGKSSSASPPDKGRQAVKPAGRPAIKPLRRGLDWLMQQQAEDGGWHSKTYGALRDGAALTAFALYSATAAPGAVREQHRARLQRGYAFLEQGIRKKGFACSPDGTLDYPTYASAMTLIAIRTSKLTAAPEDLAKLDQFILDGQLTAADGFPADSPDLGGWDFLGGTGAKGTTSGSNVSVTAFALESLIPIAAAEGARTRVLKWIDGCQNLPGDGGFVFHPQRDHLGNKAGWRDDGSQPVSYGTATCDGLRCLLLAGAKPTDPRVAAGAKWLKSHDKVETVPGFEQSAEHLQDWQLGLKFYYLFAMADALHRLKSQADAAWIDGRRRSIAEALIGRQQADGQWANTSSRMREDDALIATCLATAALGKLSQA